MNSPSLLDVVLGKIELALQANNYGQARAALESYIGEKETSTFTGYETFDQLPVSFLDTSLKIVQTLERNGYGTLGTLKLLRPINGFGPAYVNELKAATKKLKKKWDVEQCVIT